jgi:hypothetical protein
VYFQFLPETENVKLNLENPVNPVWEKICPLNLEPGNYIYSQILNMLYLRLCCDVRRY